MRVVNLIAWSLLSTCIVGSGYAQTSSLPADTDEPAGTLKVGEFPLGEAGPKATKFRFSVPENRAAENSRNIELVVYQFKARTPSDRAPVFLLGGGPGQFFDDKGFKSLSKKPTGGPLLELWEYLENHDVVVVNQRGAGPEFISLMFWVYGRPLDEAYDYQDANDAMKKNCQLAVDQLTKIGIDLAGYDIMNMVQDMEDVRQKLDYKKISLRGTSFGSQWAFSYMRQFPEHVDRAILGGVEPIDHGWDSPQGLWNVMKRLEEQIESADRSELGFPSVPLTKAIQTIVKRLESKAIEREVGSKTLVIGPQDFQRALIGGHGGHREQLTSFKNLPKFVYETYNENFQPLIAKAKGKQATSLRPLQTYLVDNSLGISQLRETKLEQEEGRRWIGELNAGYKATRTVTPSPVIPDSFRTLRSDLPILMAHGDFDLSTPIENAEEQMKDLTNAHLIRIHGGTHGAIPQIMNHDEQFVSHLVRFLEADLTEQSVASLKLPTEISLPPLEFAPMK